MRAALVSYFQQDGYTDPLEGNVARLPALRDAEAPMPGFLFQDPRRACRRTYLLHQLGPGLPRERVAMTAGGEH